jgi:hypothetical protein
VNFLFRNPHSFVHIEAKDDECVLHRWAVEWGRSGQRRRDGITPQALHPGDVVGLAGNLGQIIGCVRKVLHALFAALGGKAVFE